MKKTLAIILTLALVICMMPASAFADGNLPEKTDLSKAVITLGATETTYNGTSQAPTVQSIKVNGTDLSTSSTADYTVTWDSNEFINAGTYTLTVNATEGSQTYFGSKTVVYTIKKLGLKDAANVSIVETNPITTVDNAKTNIAVKYKSVTIPTGEYSIDAKASGNGMVLVTVTANTNATNLVAGEAQSASFFLRTQLDDNNYTAVCSDVTYDGTVKTPKVTVKKKNAYAATLTEGTDYRVTYKDNTKAGAATFTVTGIKAYYGEIPGSFKINPKNIASTNISVDNVSIGQTVSITVMDGTTKLTKGTDYTIVGDDSSSTGTKTLVITGINNYTGTVNKSFTVVSGNNIIDDVDVTIVGAGATKVKQVYYNGANQTVSVNVAKSGATYRIEYRKGTTVLTGNSLPKDSGDYSVYAIGTGNYAGTAYAGKLTIMPIPLDWTEIVLGSATVYDTSSRTYVPKVTLRTKSGYTYGYTGNVIIPETDYNVSYRWVNSTSAYLRPTAVVTKAAKAVNLADATNKIITEITKEFNTATKNLAYCTASFTDGRSSSAYTGSAVTPKVTVRDGYTTLDPSTYTVTYKNASGKVVSSMRDAGTYTVVIKGNGAYYGELTLTYTITGTDIGNYTVTLKESSVTADGRTKTPVITSVSYGYYSKLSSSDYTVSYQDSTGKEVKSYQMSTPGTYKVVVTGKNGYTGSCYATFTIVGLSQSITGVDGSYKVYPTSETFRLYPKATEGRFTYTSSDPSVASVDAFGNVTPYKAGRAKITISTTGNVRYNPVTTSTVIKVYPNKAAMTRKPWTAGKGKIKVRWNKQDNVTRYEVRYSKNKSFKKGTYKTKKVNAAVNAYTTQSTTLSGLNSGYTYYVKVRAVKEVYNDYGKKLTYYGKWSGWRSVRVK